MPGVPSSRGCNACRKQRKKVGHQVPIDNETNKLTHGGAQCDIENFPCSRCQRLKIPCIGHGQRRWKFKDESAKLIHETQAKSSSNQPDPHKQISIVQPSCGPSNHQTRQTSVLFERFSPSLDVRFQLTWNFGGFLLEIPRRLGVSRALDAASDALIAAHARFCMRNFDLDHDLLTKHSRALNALRHELSDSVKARSAETLCAILVIMITEVGKSCAYMVSLIAR